MDNQNKNLILATALSFAVILVWFVVFPPPTPDPAVQDPATVSEQPAPGADPAGIPVVADAAGPGAAADASTTVDKDLRAASRAVIDSDSLTGTISMLGGRIDDLSLKDYRVSLEPDAPIVQVLTPADNDEYFYAVYGWSPGNGLDAADVPGA